MGDTEEVKARRVGISCNSTRGFKKGESKIEEMRRVAWEDLNYKQVVLAWKQSAKVMASEWKQLGLLDNKEPALLTYTSTGWWYQWQQGQIFSDGPLNPMKKNISH